MKIEVFQKEGVGWIAQIETSKGRFYSQGQTKDMAVETIVRDLSLPQGVPVVEGKEWVQ